MAQTGKAGRCAFMYLSSSRAGPAHDGVPWRHLHAAKPESQSRRLYPASADQEQEPANCILSSRRIWNRLGYLAPIPCGVLSQSQHELPPCDVHLCSASVGARLSKGLTVTTSTLLGSPARCNPCAAPRRRACQKLRDETDMVTFVTSHQVDADAQILRCCRARLTRLG
jgi:hypothetical protein